MPGDNTTVGFVQEHAVIVPILGSALIAILVFLFKQNRSLKQERRDQADTYHDKQITQLREITVEFKKAMEEIVQESRVTTALLHERITSVAISHAKIEAEHNRMMAVCPIANRQVAGC